MATTLAHDVAEFCTNEGSPVFFCSLDVEGAFDCIPFSILFESASRVLPEMCWRTMFFWYSHMRIQIRWNNKLSSEISVERGTRQGGLTSPLIFNAFYQDLVQKLQNNNQHGIVINGITYNVFAYADDLLLASTTVTGLQSLIDLSVSQIEKCGLRFNPKKTICMCYGKNPFTTLPKWNINSVNLDVKNSIKYLGSVLCQSGGNEHVNSRICSAKRSFYTLQGAGLCNDGLSPEASVYLYSSVIRSSLIYGCDSIWINKSNMIKLDSTQGKIIKKMLGLPYTSHTTPLIQALGILPCSVSILFLSLDLLKSCLASESATGDFYRHMLNCDRQKVKNPLMGRTGAMCDKFNINFIKYMLNEKYSMHVKHNHYSSASNGYIDSLRTLLSDFNNDNRILVRMMLKSF